jgi:hypothetical protein
MLSRQTPGLPTQSNASFSTTWQNADTPCSKGVSCQYRMSDSYPRVDCGRTGLELAVWNDQRVEHVQMSYDAALAIVLHLAGGLRDYRREEHERRDTVSEAA